MTDERAERKERARKRRIETARELEGRGHLDHAVKEFLRAGEPGEAARALALKGRLADAAEAILKGLKVEGTDVAPLAAEDRALVEQAAVFLEGSQQGGRAQALRDALKAAPPPPEGATSRVGGPPSEPPSAASSGSSARPAVKPSAAPAPAKPTPSASAPSAPAPSAPGMASGSFRPPVTTSGSFRAPASSSGSFRAPSGASASFRPPAGPPSVESASFRAPGRPESKAPAAAPRAERPTPTGTGTSPERPRAPIAPVVPPATPSGGSARPPTPVEKKLGLDSGSFRAPKIEPIAKEEPASPPPSKQKLSASGEVVSDYSASRSAGWRDADDDALERSIQEHLSAGRKGAAARVARDAGQIGRALAWFNEIGLHAQAGACLRQLGRPAEALVELLKVDTSGPGYRKACFEVIAIVAEIGTLSFDVDRFLTGFVTDGPADPDEVTTYVELARLYMAGGFSAGAKRCLREVLETSPDHVEARELEAELRRERQARRSVAPRTHGAPASARGLPPLPTLEEFRKLAREHAPEG